MRFTRLVPVEGSILNDFEFDSSPNYSLSKALGTDPDRFELRESSSTPRHITYEVWSANYPTDSYPEPRMQLRGHLRWEREETRLMRQG